MTLSENWRSLMQSDKFEWIEGYKNDPEFVKLFNETKEKIPAKVNNQFIGIAAGPFKSYNVAQYARAASQFPGCMAEVGVFSGGTARIISKTVPWKALHLFDTFTGIHEIGFQDKKIFKNAFNTPGLLGIAQRAVDDCPSVQFHIGWFPDSIPNDLRTQKFNFVHADADVYPSTKSICQFFFPRMTPGGIILFDDYGFEETPGARLAVDEFFKNKYEKPLVLPGGQAVIIKSDDTFYKKEHP